MVAPAKLDRFFDGFQLISDRRKLEKVITSTYIFDGYNTLASEMTPVTSVLSNALKSATVAYSMEVLLALS